MYVDTKLKFNIEPSHCDVLIGQAKIATVSYSDADKALSVKFAGDLPKRRFHLEHAIDGLAETFNIQTRKAAQIVSLISGDLE